jgi:hypothetical protein
LSTNLIARRRVIHHVSTSVRMGRVKWLFDRLRLLLRKRMSGPGAPDRLGLPCAACGEPATGWSYVAHDRNGQRVIDGYATCAAHRSDESIEKLAGTRAG